MRSKSLSIGRLQEIAANAQTIRNMMLDHLDSMMEQGVEVCFYICRFPLDAIRIVQYKDQPVRKIFLREELLLSIELRPNPLDTKTVDTWLDGGIADLMKFEIRSPLVAV